MARKSGTGPAWRRKLHGREYTLLGYGTREEAGRIAETARATWGRVRVWPWGRWGRAVGHFAVYAAESRRPTTGGTS